MALRGRSSRLLNKVTELSKGHKGKESFGAPNPKP